MAYERPESSRALHYPSARSGGSRFKLSALTTKGTGASTTPPAIGTDVERNYFHSADIGLGAGFGKKKFTLGKLRPEHDVRYEARADVGSEERDDHGSNNSQVLIIKKGVEWSVEYERRGASLAESRRSGTESATVENEISTLTPLNMMHNRPFGLRLMPRRPPVQDPEEPQSSEPAAKSRHYYAPSYTAIVVVRALLESMRLPTELVLDILDRACYWPEQNFESTERISAEGNWASHGQSSSAKVCLYADILSEDFVRSCGEEKPKVKEVEFEIKAHDQGWTSENTRGTYETTSWLETSILRRDPASGNHAAIHKDALTNNFGSPKHLQNNIHDLGWTLVVRPGEDRYPQNGEGNFAWYLQGNKVSAPARLVRVVWGEQRHEGNAGTGDQQHFLENLQEGDNILVWARAKYPGWQCQVDSIKMTIRYGF
ncbi:hypothetical protein P154DRAFT_528609 [Amniculicola lignicola CBS 123094]|uniref:Uncharacterized protein n=1 Tax=Amniculicola lignicola CBS 123094 TaxID=1392246 RepID=A0A6A5X4T0_9PLEO|nr:hypothetical protein P154DRAFT_528609 [Amniculicola lignicola CBS 123094]